MNRNFLSIRVSAAAIVAVLAACGACAGGATTDAGQDADDVERATCDVAVGGVALSPAVLESTPGYDDELAARDLDALPLTLSIVGLDLTAVSLIAFALEINLTELPDALSTSTVRARGPMGDAVAASYVDGQWDLDFLRRGIHRFYACDRRFPVDLAGFEKIYGAISDLTPVEIPLSIPKQGPRVIRENPERHVYVAESLENGVVRETEIVLGGTRSDGALDFLVYDADGSLMDRSRFATVTGGETVSASPFSCLTCHVDYERQTYDVISPTE